jgi:hypothetical protein
MLNNTYALMQRVRYVPDKSHASCIIPASTQAVSFRQGSPYIGSDAAPRTLQRGRGGSCQLKKMQPDAKN